MGMMTETGLPLRVTISGSGNIAFIVYRLSRSVRSRKARGLLGVALASTFSLLSPLVMRWRQRYNYVRPARPKARSLQADEAGQISARLKAAIDRSPILRAFGVQVRSLRNRFYLDWRWDPVDEAEAATSYGRITPLEQSPGE